MTLESINIICGRTFAGPLKLTVSGLVFAHGEMGSFAMSCAGA